MRRTSGKVVLVHAERPSTSDDLIDHIELRRSGRATFSVAGARCDKAQATTRHRWSNAARSNGLRTPMQIKAALDQAAKVLGVDLDWIVAIPVIAKLDWISAAAIASTMNLDLPRLPPTGVLLSQRSLRALGRVEVGVEWGYELQSISLTFERWCRILGGEPFTIQEPYWYDGEKFNGCWQFDGRHRLGIGYRDGGVGWTGGLDEIDLISGPEVDEVDLANVALLGALHG